MSNAEVRSRPSGCGMVLATLFFLLMGIGWWYEIFQMYQISKQQDDWRLTPAVVIEARRGGAEDDTCKFRYEYVVDEKRFTSTRYAADGRQCVGLHRFNESDAIEVFYSFDNPKLAVVEKLSPSIFRMLWGGTLGFVFIFIGLATLLAFVADTTD